MKEYFKDRIIIESNDKYLVNDFMNGDLSITDIVKNFELFKNKEIGYSIKHALYNRTFGSFIDAVKKFVQLSKNKSFDELFHTYWIMLSL